MVVIPGGRRRLGSDEHYPEERPAREIDVAAFSIDITPVTNDAFSRFVGATGYVTVAERVEPAGSAVFRISVIRRTGGTSRRARAGASRKARAL
jgi:formylglycine-generating enzyme required for sulfatase activity